jgi:phosphatidylethanolamine-binding protein (PEBP) family uncharacterized protein
MTTSTTNKTYNEKHEPKIIRTYTEAGITPPKGKGMHTLKFHQMAVALMKKGLPKDMAYATAMKKLGRDRSVKKSHRRTYATQHPALLNYSRVIENQVNNLVERYIRCPYQMQKR